MPIRIPTCTVIVQRNGKNFAPPIGKSFEFTADEVAAINKVMPVALRKPVNETVEAPVAAPEAKPEPLKAGRAGSSSSGRGSSKSHRASSSSSSSGDDNGEL